MEHLCYSTLLENKQQQNIPIPGGLGGLAGLGTLGMGSANFMETQQRVQRELMSNPDMLRQVLDNPLTQSLMSNPDIMRQMLESNPQMQVH